ncbi:hypothetical protein HPDFL43_05110 [Hoeflea phototrophica DFL-43]|uniref:Lipoprotein n=1 Tax=Hoeflea phototrophica (strain DSM 17068 / NCIMB 14078 / DFL-43) TaxID=411684 RepID=A9D439_HOEPD|nr:hypothetical protein [Hoeflea phototrophica]EDQ33805.2 hypothetical protein HPDFL43_05110 [Hoeflea phototrophica DFL-43]
MLPSMSALKSLGIVIALAGGCATAVIAPSPVHAITGSDDTGPGERSDVETITFDTLLSMSEPGLVIVRNNPRAYRLKHPRLAERHLDTLANALIYAPNKTRRFLQRLARAKSTQEKRVMTWRILSQDVHKASKLDYNIQIRAAELRKKGHLVNYRMIGVFGQRSSDPAVQDLYRMHDQYTAQRAFNNLLRAASWQLSQMD